MTWKALCQIFYRYLLSIICRGVSYLGDSHGMRSVYRFWATKSFGSATRGFRLVQNI